MSNWKHAYGWSGHIIANAAENEGGANDNVIAVPEPAFRALVTDYENCTLDDRISVEQLGVIDAEPGVLFLACGTSFSEGFEFYGTVFAEAELRSERQPITKFDDDYRAAMKEKYGIELPPCRLMIGCSSEH